ncbi:MAG TPA: S8 family serine peptidase [candidate division Zixibacteria bacterium]|nr:S8 family serine peptidase [candidate division Zixibacteria bacterium]
MTEARVKRNHRTLLSAGLLILLLVLWATPISAQLYDPEHLVIEMYDGYDIGCIHDAYGTSTAQYLPNLNMYLVNAPAGSDLLVLSSEIESRTGVRTCHPNYMTDPMQAVQGSLPVSDDIDQELYITQGPLSSLDLSGVHTVSTGAGVKVAVIDGGVDFTHPGLEGSVVSVYDYVDADSVAFDEPGGENSGHGTFIAGVIHCVAPGAQIYAYRVSDIHGLSNGYVVAEAMKQAADDGCRVINLSQVMTGYHTAIRNAVAYCLRVGCVTIVAAGNGGDSRRHYPAYDYGTVAVAAVDSNFVKADFSCYGSYISVCAPGVDLISTFNDDLYARWSGTSFAAPVVAGQAALIIAARPDLSSYHVATAINASAVNIDDLNPGLAGMLGSGLIDIAASLVYDPVVCGDVDGDGGCDIADVVSLMSYICFYDTSQEQITPLYLSAADVDSDPGITSNDVAHLWQYMFEGGIPPCDRPEAPVFEVSGDVWLNEVEGQLRPCTLAVGVPVTFRIRASIDQADGVRYFSNGFHLWSPDGATWSARQATYNGTVYDVPANRAFFGIDREFATAHELSCIGASYDTLETMGAFSWAFPVTPSGTSGDIYEIMIGAFDENDVGKTIILDSSSFGNAGTWEWTANGTNRFSPRWPGPYVFVIGETSYTPGDVNGDSELTIDDILYLVQYMFHGGPLPVNVQSCDVNGSCGPIDIADLTFLVQYFFGDGPEPVYGCSQVVSP